MSCSHANSFITLNASFSRSESPTKSVTSRRPSLVLALNAAMGSSLWTVSYTHLTLPTTVFV